MPKICVYAISKNEEQFVDRFMESVQSADYVVVLDTGSTDNTVEKLKKRGALVEQKIITPWRFDVARNEAIKICPLDSDIFFSIDLDEIIIEPDWKERILSSWCGHNRGRYHYVWDHRSDGTDGVSFLYEKIHTRNYEWFLPCHEIMRPIIPGEDRWADIDITVSHYPDPVKSRGNYLPLLKMATTEYPDNDRVAHYYGRELFFRNNWPEAIQELERHVHLKTATWADERCASMIMIGHCYKALNAQEEAEKWYLRACGEAPHLREPFIEASKFYNEGHRYPMGYALAKRALQIENKPFSYLATPYAWNEGPHDLIAVSAYYIGLKPESLASARVAHEKAPWDPRLKENLEIITRMSPELGKPVDMPKIIRHEQWIDDPKFGLVIATWGSVPYVHLALAVRDKLYKDVPTLVIDDNSPQREQLRALAQQYGVEFFSHQKSYNHTRGDVMAMVTGLRWANDMKLDVIVKMSRRFIPKTDWRPSLRQLTKETVHATYVGALDGTWGLRTECIGLHVKKWLPYVNDLKETVNNSSWLWVEKLIQDHAIKILPWGTGNLTGAAMWDFVGLGKWIKTDTHLWHDTSNVADYHYLATQYGLSYVLDDFKALLPSSAELGTKVDDPFAKPSAWIGLETKYQDLCEIKDPTAVQRVVDIGVDYGFSTFHLAHDMPNAEVIGVSDFKLHADSMSWVNSHLHLFPNIKILCGDSEALGQNFGNPVDILLIDGDHSYEGVKRDFDTWSPWVNKGGRVLFHDTESAIGVRTFFDQLPGRKKEIKEHHGLGCWFKDA